MRWPYRCSARRLDADDPAHLAFAVFAHDWRSALAQAVAVSTRGARSFASLMVVACLVIAHVANAAQLDAARREPAGEEPAPSVEKPPCSTTASSGRMSTQYSGEWEGGGFFLQRSKGLLKSGGHFPSPLLRACVASSSSRRGA